MSYCHCVHVIPSLCSCHTVTVFISYHHCVHVIPSLCSCHTIYKGIYHIAFSWLLVILFPNNEAPHSIVVIVIQHIKAIITDNMVYLLDADQVEVKKILPELQVLTQHHMIRSHDHISLVGEVTSHRR